MTCGGQRAEVGLADESAERGERGLRTSRRVGDEMNRASDQRPSGERKGERGQSAGSCGRGCHRERAAGRAARPARLQSARSPGCSQVPRRHRSQALRGLRQCRCSRRRARPGSIGRATAPRNPRLRRRAPRRRSTRARAAIAQSIRRSTTRANTCAARRAATSSNHREHGDDGKRSGAARRGTRINPPAAPPRSPASPPPIDAPAHRAAANAAARRSRASRARRAVANGAGSPKIGTGPASATSHRVSRSSARANAWRGRVPRRRSASSVPSACSSSAASR